MENFSEEIVANIKHENSPEDEGSNETNETFPRQNKKRKHEHGPQINLEKFDGKWKTKANLSASYIVCNICDSITEQGNSKLINQKCEFCESKFSCSKCRKKHEAKMHKKSVKHEVEEPTPLKSKKSRKSTEQLDDKQNKTVKRKADVVLKVDRLPQSNFSPVTGFQFKCTFCRLQFLSTVEREKHVAQDHVSGSNWKCSICPYNTLKKEYLRKHWETHNKQFTCESCDQKFSKSYGLKNHQMQHRHGTYISLTVPQYNCTRCQKSFATVKSLGDHKKNVHPKPTLGFECDLCGATFKNKVLARCHIKRHFKVPCPICRRMVSKQRLKDHVEENHSEISNSQCEVCGKVFRSQNLLYMHMNGVHKVEEQSCDICNKTYKNAVSLRQHRAIHVLVQCPDCGDMVGKYNLENHKKLNHSGLSEFVCEQCDFKTMRPQTYEKHLKRHLQINLIEGSCFECSTCHYKTKRYQNLTRHMKRKSHGIL